MAIDSPLFQWRFEWENQHSMMDSPRPFFRVSKRAQKRKSCPLKLVDGPPQNGSSKSPINQLVQAWICLTALIWVWVKNQLGHESTRLLRGSASETVCWCILTTQPANLLPIEPYYAKQLILQAAHV